MPSASRGLKTDFSKLGRCGPATGTSDTWGRLTLTHCMMHTCTHEAARGYAPPCPDGAPCLPVCLLVSINFRQNPGLDAIMNSQIGVQRKINKAPLALRAPNMEPTSVCNYIFIIPRISLVNSVSTACGRRACFAQPQIRPTAWPDATRGAHTARQPGSRRARATARAPPARHTTHLLGARRPPRRRACPRPPRR
eukprot:7383471-Prymnesium_polylepis.1